MKNITKLVFMFLFISLILPNFALASWWNPFSWFNNWNFISRQNKTEILEKRIQELENKLGESTSTKTDLSKYGTPISKATTTIKKTDSTQIKQPVISISSKDMIEAIDSYILKSKTYLDDVIEYSGYIDYYTGTFTKSRDAALSLINIETDPYLMSVWQYTLKVDNISITYFETLKNGSDIYSINTLRNSINILTTSLIQIKSTIPAYYTSKEVYSTDFEKIINYYFDSAKKLTDDIYQAKKKFFDAIKIGMTKISDTQSQVETYMSNASISRSAFNSTIYQPVVLPQIKTPTFTHCSYQYSGYGQSNMTCYDSAF